MTGSFISILSLILFVKTINSRILEFACKTRQRLSGAHKVPLGAKNGNDSRNRYAGVAIHNFIKIKKI